MGTLTGVVLLAWLAVPSQGAAGPRGGAPVHRIEVTEASSPASGRLLAAAARAGACVAMELETPEAWDRSAPVAPKRGWIARHPALFGTLIGAGAGALAAVTMENELFCSRGDEDCFFHGGGRTLVGAGFGAGIGALTGWVVSLGTK